MMLLFEYYLGREVHHYDESGQMDAHETDERQYRCALEAAGFEPRTFLALIRTFAVETEWRSVRKQLFRPILIHLIDRFQKYCDL